MPPSTKGWTAGSRPTPRRRRQAPLPVLYSEELERPPQPWRLRAAVILPIFSFPGGRRFHFRDPAGNELAVWGEWQRASPPNPRPRAAHST